MRGITKEANKSLCVSLFFLSTAAATAAFAFALPPPWWGERQRTRRSERGSRGRVERPRECERKNERKKRGKKKREREREK